jgi:hypothetical protein
VTSRSIILAGGLVCLLIAGLVPTLGQPGSKSQAAQKQEITRLEQRVADLQDQLAKLHKEVEDLRVAGRPPGAAPGGPAGAVAPPVKLEFAIYALKRANAAEMAKVLQQFFQGPDGNEMRIVPDRRTNTVLVRGSRQQLEMVEAIVARLDEMEGDDAPKKAP